jgi:putative ABC transport system permease protein
MERELTTELQFHLDMLAEQYMAQGMAPDEARRVARQVFGGVERVKDDVRDTWLTRIVEAVAQDVRYGLRGLRKQVGYAFAVVATMALGIGANSAIFSVVNAVALQPLPYQRGEDLVLLKQERSGLQNTGFAIKDIADLKSLSATLDAVVEFHSMYFILLGGWEPARVATGVVSWDYFETLGVRPLLGRTFVASDDHAGGPATLVLSYDYWQRAFNGDPAIIGRAFTMNDARHTVVGVLPNVPIYPEPNDVYMPRGACPFRADPRDVARRGAGMASAIGRRKPGVTLWEAQADLDAVARKLQLEHPESYPSDRGHGFRASALRQEFTRDFESTLGMLLGAAGFVLVIVCASIANLSLARTLKREHELSIRTALGASRGRLFRQLLTENVILSFMGAAAGLLLAVVSMQLLVGYVARFTQRASEIRIDTTVLLYTLGISLATGLFAGAIPAVSRRLASIRTSVRQDGRASRPRDLRQILIVAQVAISFMLLIGAGLMVRSFAKLTSVDPGFSTERALTMQIDLNFSKYTTGRSRSEYLQRIESRLQQVPGTVYVGASGSIPLLENTGGGILEEFVVDGRPLNKDQRPRASARIASDDYFRAMNVPLLSGRFFQPTDAFDAPHVVIVNESLARRNWLDGNPVGQRISGDGVHWHTIVGVVADVRQQLSQEPEDEIYHPLRRFPWVTTNWVIRSSTDLEALAPLVRAAIYDVEPGQPIHRMRPLEEVRAASLTPPRLTTTLLGMFAGLALLITASGIGGVIAFSVGQRTQELGVRVAFGARRADLVSMILGEGVKLAAVGLALGIVGALLLRSLLATLLFGVEPTDALTYVVVSSLLLTVAALACLAPALRAAATDPLEALKAL